MVATTTGRATDFITFSRTSNATVTGADGRIRWAGHNLLTNSESFDASAWSKANATSTDPVVSANAGVAPNGTTTADRIDFGAIDAAGDYSIVSQLFTAPGAPLTASVWVKALAAGDVGKKIGIYLYDTGIVGVAFVTLTADWQQLTTSGTLSAGGSRSYVIGTLGSAFTGGVNQGAVSVLVWGAHLYRSDLGSMVLNPARGDAYYPTTPRNLLGFTEDFSNAAWVKADVNPTYNAVIAPNGLQTADLFVPNTNAAGHSLYQISSAGGLNAQSVYVKPFGYTKVALRESQTGAYYASYDLTGAGSVLTSSSATAAISAVGDGWYRISMIGTISGTTRFSVIVLPNSYTSGSVINPWSGDGTSGIYLWGAQLSDSASLDAYSPVYGAAVTSAAYYAPRLDYDANGSALGLLVEEQRVNLVSNSNDLGAANWGLGNATIATNVATSPDGTSSADKLTGDGTNSGHYVRSNVTLAINTTYTLSAYVKTAELQWFYLAVGGTGASAGGAPVSTFNATTVAVGSTSANITSRSIASVGNGWCRAQITFTTAGSVSGNFVEMSVANTDTNGVNTASGGILYYGVQLEAGAFPTSLIPTGSAGAGATRTADVASVSTQAFPYSATEGTIVAAYQLLANTGTLKRVFDLYDTTKGVYENIIAVNGVNPAQTTIFAEVVNGSSSQASFNLGTPSVGVNKSALAFKVNDFNAAHNGVVGTTDPTGTVPTANTLRIGAHADSTVLNGWIRQITYLPRRISNTELQARTV